MKTTERQQPQSSTSPQPGTISQPNKNCGSVTHQGDETPNEERTGLSEREQRPEYASSNSSDSILSGAVDSKETVVTGSISGPETPTEERAESTINDQHQEGTPSTLSRQGPEKAVECKEAAVTNTTNETNGDQKDLSCAAPNTPSPPLEEQKEPIVNQDLNGGNTTTDTVVVDAETVRGPAVLEAGSEFSNPSEVGSTYSAGQETTSRELSEKERSASESASRATMESTEPQQKAPETQVLLGSSSEIKDSKTDAQVSNMHKDKTPKLQFLPFQILPCEESDK